MFASFLPKTVMFPAAANLVVMRRELDSMVGTMWTSFAGCLIIVYKIADGGGCSLCPVR